MMKSIRNVDFLKDSYQKLLSTVREIQKPNAKEKILIESLIGDGTNKARQVTIPERMASGYTIRRLKSACLRLLPMPDSM